MDKVEQVLNSWLVLQEDRKTKTFDTVGVFEQGIHALRFARAWLVSHEHIPTLLLVCLHHVHHRTAWLMVFRDGTEEHPYWLYGLRFPILAGILDKSLHERFGIPERT